jgi:hypothetical protein
MIIDDQMYRELEKQAGELVNDYKPAVDITKMSAEDLAGFIRLATKRMEEQRNDIMKLREQRGLPQTILRLMVENRRGALFKSYLETELAERTGGTKQKEIGEPTEPVTCLNFKQKFIQKMADPKAGNDATQALKLLMKDVKPEDRGKINEYLYAEGFTGPAAANAVLTKWIQEAESSRLRIKEYESPGR